MTEVAPGRHRVFAYADLATLDPHLAGWCMIWGGFEVFLKALSGLRVLHRIGPMCKMSHPIS